MKTIKKNYIQAFLLILAFSLAPIMSNAQSFFEKYEDLEEVSTIVVTKKMFQLLAKVSGDSKDAREYKEMVLGLENLTVFTTENATVSAKMKGDVARYLKKSKLSELMRIKDKDANVKIFIQEGKDEDHVKELFMYISSLSSLKIDNREPEVVIVSLTGDINLNKISDLVDKMNIPGGEHLKKAGEND